MMNAPTHAQQRGATLIEVMVSALIVSFGILAMIALQSNAIKYNKTSEYRSIATLLANDLADRIRVNTDQALASSNNYDLTARYSQPASVPTRPSCAIPATCTAAELAQLDLGEWRRALYFSLPGGNGYVTTDKANRAVDVWVAWIDPGEASAPVGDNGAKTECPSAFLPSGASATRPRCMYFHIGLPTPVGTPAPAPAAAP
jgi:type IV pilus assembly protein PilV